MSHCPDCPIAPGRRCPGEGARRVCDLIDPRHPAYRAAYVGSIIEADRQAAPTAPADAPSVAESLALLAAARACPYRSTADCGCSGARCALRGGAVVSHPDCFDCIRAYP